MINHRINFSLFYSKLYLIPTFSQRLIRMAAVKYRSVMTQMKCNANDTLNFDNLSYGFLF